ncbi:MAG TPA: glycoside hydrolase family 2 protein [Firmicutes bacterium]|nr:glycoside hydrolase family 2 protein [Bacillota bacterium]
MRRLDLSGVWQLSQLGSEESIPAQVPGDNYSALLEAGKIPDPYWGDNELAVQWVGQTDWVYSRRFTIDEDILAETSVFLSCEGLDTIADIYINGQHVGSTDNMFRRYRFEVKEYCRLGDNEIQIVIHSPVKTAVERSGKLPYEIPHSQFPIQAPHVNLVRKTACHGGWDWGPCLMVSGIYGHIYIGATSLGRIEYVYTAQSHGDGMCKVEVTAEVISPEGGETELQVTLGDIHQRKPVVLNPGMNIVSTELTVVNPQLWWPNGSGSQHLYDLTVAIAGDEVRKRLGLRKLEVVTEEDDIGLSFKIRVNGVDIFCKGANWIPADALPQRQTRERLDELLSSAAAAHMNMLRVWGGGQYESDDFYELCDEKGIMIWHDFMFSCALYPATKEFLANVREEVIHQVKRLRDHACIALWCGNNECLGALNWFEVSRRNRDRYLVDYDRLYEGTIGRAVDEADPTRLYWPSSPCGGRGDYSDNWHEDSRGDMHYWTVWHENASFDAYFDVVPRFCSEFGYQSFPSLETIASFAPPDQFNPTAPFMEHHQRHPGGNSRIVEMMTRYFRVPEGFENFIFLSQVQQGLAMKTGVEYWRHLQPICMGTLYWQLNDVWPVCSWSSLEYSGRWKLLHYLAKRFYAPVIVTAFQNKEDELEIWVVNDQHREQTVTVTLQIWDFAGQIRKEEQYTGAAAAGGAVLLAKRPLADLAPKPHEVFAFLELTGDGVYHYNDHFFTEYKKCHLPDVSIKAAVKEVDGGYQVEVASDMPAFFVSLEARGIRGEFDDNCFTLLPGKPRTLVFTAKDAVSLEQFQNSLKLYHLRATYR